jgi:hypothetical protein
VVEPVAYDQLPGAGILTSDHHHGIDDEALSTTGATLQQDVAHQRIAEHQDGQLLAYVFDERLGGRDDNSLAIAGRRPGRW